MNIDADSRTESVALPDLASMSWAQIADWKAEQRCDFLSKVQDALASGRLTPAQASKLHDTGGRFLPASPPAEDLFEPLG